MYHACYLLVIKPWEDACNVLTFVTVARLATTVKKLAVIASQTPTGEFWFHALKWLGT
jgi:tRNA splicing endonuclease